MPGQVIDDIAVVGIAHKLPGDVEDDSSFWKVLEQGTNLSGNWPEGRMNAESHVHPKSDKVSND